MRYGISLAYGPEDKKEFFKNFSEPFFKGIELPGIFLNNPELKALLFERKYDYINFTDVMSSSLTREIADQQRNMINEFHSQFNLIVTQIANLRADSFTMDFSIDSEMNRESSYQSRIALLKKLSVKLLKENIKLSIPVRIPFWSDKVAEFHLNLLKEVMSPQLGIVIDIYPHKLGGVFNPKDLLKWLQFDTNVIRLIYEPEVGNKLVKKLVTPWIEQLDKMAFKGVLLFCPKVSNSTHFNSEIILLKNMLSE